MGAGRPPTSRTCSTGRCISTGVGAARMKRRSRPGSIRSCVTARRRGAEGILFTGSFFGEAVKRARATIAVPVLTSFEGVIDRALDLEQPLHVVATTADSVTLLRAELERGASDRSRSVSVSGQAVAGAMEALTSGDPDRAVVFAQFSMEGVLDRSAAGRAAPVIGPAREGVALLRQLLAKGGTLPQS